MKLNNTLTATLTLCLSLTANAQLSSPGGLAFDGSGNLWVTNGGAKQVLELDPTNGAILNTITKGISGPTRLFFLGGELYVVNSTANNMTIYDNLTTSGANLVGTIDFPSTVSRSLGAAVDASGNVYASGNATNNIVVFNTNGIIETLTQDTSGFPFTAPGALVIQGQDIYAGFGSGDSEDAVISYNLEDFLSGDPQEITVYNDNVNTGPTGIAFDSENNVYISEFYSGTAVKYNLGQGTKPVLVINQGTGWCEGIAVDSSGNIYVSNAQLNNITVYGPSGGAPIRTLVGLHPGVNATFSTKSLTFATQLLNTASAAQTVTITNYGTETLTFTGTSVQGDFASTRGCRHHAWPPDTLASGASCWYGVTFTPASVGNLSGEFSITDNAPGGAQTLSLAGVSTEVELSPSALEFHCSSGSQQATLTNVGGSALSISGITVTSSSVFTQTNNCGSSVAPGGSCTITVTTKGGNSGGAVSISDDGGASPQQLLLAARCGP